MNKLRQIAPVLAPVLLVMGTSVAFGWPWSVDMVWQAAIRPYDQPMKASPAGTLPIAGSGLGWSEAGAEDPLPATPESIEEGKKLYGIYCAVCHGGNARGAGPVGTKFPMDAPDLLLGRPLDYIYIRIRDGGVFMPSAKESLSSAEAWSVVNYIKSLEQE